MRASHRRIAAEVVHNDNCPLWIAHADHLAHHSTRVGYHGHHVERGDKIELSVGKRQVLRVHLPQRHVTPAMLGDLRLGTGQHGRRQVDAHNLGMCGVRIQREARADTKLQDLGPGGDIQRADRASHAGPQHASEHRIVQA